jgi:predicted transcriptional regulator
MRLLEQLEGGASASRTTSHSSRMNGRKRRGRSGAGEKVRERLLATLKAGNGLQLNEVTRRSGIESGTVQYHLRKLRAKKLVRVVGNRRAARWFLKS